MVQETRQYIIPDPRRALDFQSVGKNPGDFHLFYAIRLTEETLDVLVDPARKRNTIIVPISSRDNRDVTNVHPWDVFHNGLEEVLNVSSNFIVPAVHEFVQEAENIWFIMVLTPVLVNESINIVAIVRAKNDADEMGVETTNLIVSDLITKVLLVLGQVNSA